ncbi:hypothetical protein MUS1_09405 [Marinomonas ushuaiensis DSM 15871]|uniref:Uncharacterized protein n=1 Tax=Marinomonas ushuaiensis DSM 15871 TaxID=1122207 RepID=X7E923_9GAMM|nr:hypothetical protein [Marinomonas ushuaiensis]ETX11653.1 hypothetical protein MUS1_09405 [Marinomonas ushuaiensis DSM 15871]
MKTQLLMIIAVILSSLLTISQRASAQEVSQLRWLEPSVEQRFNEVVAPDQELGSDNNYIASAFTSSIPSLPLPQYFSYRYIPNTKNIYGDINPRAPPFSSI